MSLTAPEVARVEAEAGALTGDPQKIAAAVASMEALENTPAGKLALQQWRLQGSVIRGLEPTGVILDTAKPYVSSATRQN